MTRNGEIVPLLFIICIPSIRADPVGGRAPSKLFVYPSDFTQSIESFSGSCRGLYRKISEHHYSTRIFLSANILQGHSYFYRNAVDNLKIMVRIAAQVLKKALFDVPQICTLSDKITPVWKLWEKRSPVAIKILINPLIGVESQIFADRFHCDNLTVGQFWQWHHWFSASDLESKFCKNHQPLQTH